MRTQSQVWRERWEDLCRMWRWSCLFLQRLLDSELGPAVQLPNVRQNAASLLSSGNRACSTAPQVNALYPGAFPYSFDFLYWEEAARVWHGLLSVEDLILPQYRESRPHITCNDVLPKKTSLSGSETAARWESLTWSLPATS